MGQQDPHETDGPPYTYECVDCGERVEADSRPGKCTECGGEMRNISRAQE